MKQQSVFSQMTELALLHGAINLAQGFPDEDGPDWVKESAARSILNAKSLNDPAGDPALRQALADKLLRDYALAYNPETEVTVCNGATEALSITFLGLLDPGDEVILLEPYFDCYPANVTLAGGVVRYLTTRPPHFAVDFQELESLFNSRTRAILINSPWNPVGHLWSDVELASLAAILLRFPQVILVSDEVYEHIVFAPHRHRPPATWPGLRERTVSISSFAKTFSLTGWKVGYACAPRQLTQALRVAQRALTGGGSAPLQAGYAAVLDRLPELYPRLENDYRQRRDFWLGWLKRVGFQPICPDGTYFILTDVGEDDRDFCLRLPAQVGVAALPASVLFHRPADGRGLVRWAFCKSLATLEQAGQRLLKLR